MKNSYSKKECLGIFCEQIEKIDIYVGVTTVGGKSNRVSWQIQPLNRGFSLKKKNVKRMRETMKSEKIQYTRIFTNYGHCEKNE